MPNKPGNQKLYYEVLWFVFRLSVLAIPYFLSKTRPLAEPRTSICDERGVVRSLPHGNRFRATIEPSLGFGILSLASEQVEQFVFFRVLRKRGRYAFVSGGAQTGGTLTASFPVRHPARHQQVVAPDSPANADRRSISYSGKYHRRQTSPSDHPSLPPSLNPCPPTKVNQEFQIDIHPGARFGEGVFIDHGTGIVVGETAVVGDDVSMLHRVTLGGSGVKSADRHPKVVFLHRPPGRVCVRACVFACLRVCVLACLCFQISTERACKLCLCIPVLSYYGTFCPGVSNTWCLRCQPRPLVLVPCVEPAQSRQQQTPPRRL